MKPNANAIGIAFIFSLLMLGLSLGCGTVAAVRSVFHAPAVYSQSAPEKIADKPDVSPVKSAVDKIVWIFWIGGIISIAAGAAFIVWFGLPIPGIKMIVCGVVAPIVATWFSLHYATIIACTLIGLTVWYLLTHALVLKSIEIYIEKIASGIKPPVPSIAVEQKKS
jgi:hypothetical protein